MKLAQIRHVVMVSERGSLRASAEELGVSRTSLMRSIWALEQELGTALFKRGRRPMTLTPPGEMFVRRAAAAQEELDRASREIGRSLASSTGLVSIGMSAGLPATLLPIILPPFQARFDDIQIRIVEGVFSKVERDVLDGVLDIYVGPIWPDHFPTGLDIVKLSDATGIIVGRKGHPLASATALADLANARWIAPSRLELDQIFKQLRLPRPIIAVEAGSGLSMLSAAAASDALLFLSASLLPLIERADLLTPFRLNEVLPYPSISILTQTQLPLTAAAAYLYDLIVQALGDMQPSSERSVPHR